MADHDKAKYYVKISLILQICGFLILVIGFATPYWRALHFEYLEASKTEVGLLIQGFDEGLWRRCINSVCADIDVAGRDWLQAVRFFTSFGVFASFVGTFALILYTLVDKLSSNKFIFFTSTIASFIVAGSTFLSIMIYGAIIKEGISWSFIMVTISGAVYAISGFLMIIAFFNGRKEV